MTKRQKAFAAVLLIAVPSVVAARLYGASWQGIIWGTLGCLASALVLEFFAWLTTGGPLRLEKRPSRDAVQRPAPPG